MEEEEEGGGRADGRRGRRRRQLGGRGREEQGQLCPPLQLERGQVILSAITFALNDQMARELQIKDTSEDLSFSLLLERL